jgi:hypothetical protein
MTLCWDSQDGLQPLLMPMWTLWDNTYRSSATWDHRESWDSSYSVILCRDRQVIFARTITVCVSSLVAAQRYKGSVQRHHITVFCQVYKEVFEAFTGVRDVLFGYVCLCMLALQGEAMLCKQICIACMCFQLRCVWGHAEYRECLRTAGSRCMTTNSTT